MTTGARWAKRSNGRYAERVDRFTLRPMDFLGARRGALAVSLLVLLALGGCGSADVANDLATRLQYEGYSNLSVNLNADQPMGDVVTVRARGNVGLSDEEAIESLQTVIWNSLPRQFDALDIRVGKVHRISTYQQLSQRFGPRDRELDQRQIGTRATTVLIVVALAVGLLVALVVMIAVGSYRRRRWEEREQAQRLALNPGRGAYSPPPAFG